MHESRARLILFINILIKQVQSLQDTNMDSRDYIICTKIWQLPTDLRLKKDKCPIISSFSFPSAKYYGGKRGGIKEAPKQEPIPVPS